MTQVTFLNPHSALLLALALVTVAYGMTVLERYVDRPRIVRGHDVVDVHMVIRNSDFIPSEVNVDEGDRVRIHITNLDKREHHGFSMPAYLISEYIPPGDSAEITFTADTPGRFFFRCNVFCGIDHPGMSGVMVVHEKNPD